MSITNKIRIFLINLTGYFIFKKSDLPIGIDFNEDLINKFDIQPLTIFDVGANYGQTAIHFSETFQKAFIYSFEPVNRSFMKLQKSVEGNNRIKCFNIAFGEESKKMEISLFDEEQSQLNSLKEINSSFANSSIKETINVLTLDDFTDIEHVNQIDLLKIDTEGFELEVLRGASTLLKDKKIKSVLCEVALSKKNARNTQLDDIISYLETYDYFFVGLYDTNVNYYNQGLAYSNALFILKTIK